MSVKEVYVIILTECIDPVTGKKMTEDVELSERSVYPSNSVMELVLKKHGAKYARVEKRYVLI